MPAVANRKVATNPLTAEISLVLGLPIECLVRSMYPLVTDELQAVFECYRVGTKEGRAVVLLLEVGGGETVAIVAFRSQFIAVDCSYEQPFIIGGFQDIFLHYENIYAVHGILGEIETSQTGELRTFSREELSHVAAGLNAPRSPETV